MNHKLLVATKRLCSPCKFRLTQLGRHSLFYDKSSDCGLACVPKLDDLDVLRTSTSKPSPVVPMYSMRRVLRTLLKLLRSGPPQAIPYVQKVHHHCSMDLNGDDTKLRDVNCHFPKLPCPRMTVSSPSKPVYLELAMACSLLLAYRLSPPGV